MRPARVTGIFISNRVREEICNMRKVPIDPDMVIWLSGGKGRKIS